MHVADASVTLQRGPMASPGLADGPLGMIGDTVCGAEIVALIGQGSTGVVYEGRDVESRERIAVKRLASSLQMDRHTILRLRREFELTATLDHPNLVRNLRLVLEPFPLMVMEFVDGRSLESILEAAPVAVQVGLRLALQIARGVQYLHEQGMVHRDLKPANVLVTARGLAKVGDLELVKRAMGASRGTRITGTGVLLGTPAYLAPEIVLEDAEAGLATDLYSLGATLYHLFAGRPPYEGRTHVDVLRKVVAGPPPEISSLSPKLPAEIARLVNRLLAREAHRRPAAAAFVAALDALDALGIRDRACR